MTNFPYVGPPSGGLQLAMASARGRRYRKAGMSTSATALSLALVAVLAGSTGRTTLVQEPVPEIPAVTSVDRIPSGTVDAPTANTTGVGAVARFGAPTSLAGTPKRPGSVTGPISVGGVTSVPGAAGSRSAATPTAPYRSAAMKRDDGNSFYIPTQFQCAVNNDGTARTSPLCPSAYVYTPNGTTKHYGLQSKVCSSDTKTTTLSYGTSREVDLVIYKGTKAVWHWSRSQGLPVGEPHTLALSTGSCYLWNTEWTGVDDAGEKLPAGNGYRMVASFAAAEVSDFSTFEYAFTMD